jgi:Ankyrin repeats (3 copies)
LRIVFEQMLNQSQALSATYQPTLPSGSREGFLNRDEFFILLACLQAKLRIGDDLFQQRFAPPQETDGVRPSPATTYSFTSGLDEQLESMRTPDQFQQAKLVIIRKPIPSRQLAKPRIVGDSTGSDQIQENAPDDEEKYADGFTEYHSPVLQTPPPAFSVAVSETGSGKQPQLDVSSSWACPKCTYRNGFDSLKCDICEFRPNVALSYNEASTDEVQGSSTTPTTDVRQETSFEEPVDGMDHKEAVHFSLSTLPEVVESSSLPEVATSTLPEVALSTLPEAVPEFESGLEPVPIQNPGMDEINTPIATRASDAQALALITALEPPPVQKPPPKKSTLNIKKLGRGMLSSSKKSEKSDNTPSDPDMAASGFSLDGLAKTLGDAAGGGNLPLVSSLLKLGADVNYSSRKKEVCHYAATRAVLSKNDHVVEYLLVKGMNKISAANALHQAITRGKRTDIAMKLVPYADLNFMWAVKGDGEKTQESCLGALGRMNDDGNQDRLRLLRLIMEQPGFDVDKPAMLLESASEKVALSTLGCFTHYAGFEAVEALLLQLGDTYKVPRQQRYRSPYVLVDPLACISVKYWQREPKLALELAHLLLKHGSRITGVEEKYTPLVPAIVAGSLSGVQLLLDLGADPECVMCTVGWSTPLSPLSYAAQEPTIGIEICRALVSKGATPWRPDEQGRTALYWACRGGNFEAIKYLFKVDPARSNINKCLEAAIDSHSPEIASELVKMGACATAATWKHVMSAKPVGNRRNTYLEIIDILLATKTQLQRELVLAAIDHQNFWGLSRILEERNGILDFDKDAMFKDRRWSGVVCRANRSSGPKAKKYGWGTRRDLMTCLAYAEEKAAHDIVALLKGYDWESRAECESDCGLKLWEEACVSTAPHRVQYGYTIEVAGGDRSAG